MITKREIVVLLTSALVLGYVFEFPSFGWLAWVISSAAALLILVVNTAGKKFTAHLYDSYAEIDHWNLTRFGFGRAEYFKNPVPLWLFFPLLFSFVTSGVVSWFAVTTFDTSAKASRVRREFSNIGEWDMAIIAFGGILFSVILAFVAQLFGATDFARINLLFALFNLIPISTLDGARIFFGSRLLWVFSLAFVLSMLLLFDLAGLFAVLLIALLIAVAVVLVYFYLLDH